MQARSAGLEFITFDNDDDKTSHGNRESETQDNEISNVEDEEDTKLEYVKDNSEIGMMQIKDGDGSDDGCDDGDRDSGLDGDEKEEAGNEDTSVMFEMVEGRKTGVSKKGTEIRFRGMDLHENTATIRVTSLNFTVQCGRCKNREEMPNVKEKYEEFTVHFYHSCYLYFQDRGNWETQNYTNHCARPYTLGGGCFTP